MIENVLTVYEVLKKNQYFIPRKFFECEIYFYSSLNNNRGKCYFEIEIIIFLNIYWHLINKKFRVCDYLNIT